MTDARQAKAFSRVRRSLPIAVGAAIVVLPLGDTAVPVVGLSLSFVAMAVPALLALVVLVRDEAPLPSSLVLLGLSLGVAAGVVSAASGVDPDRSIALVVISLITLGYAFAIAFAHRPGLEVDGVDLLVVVGGVVAMMALASAGSIEAAEAGNVVNGRLTGPFAQPNELGVFCAALLPLAVAATVTAGSRRRTAVLGLSAACLAAACVLSMSRGAWIGCVVGLAALAVLAPATRRALGTVAAALAGTAVLALVLPSSAPLLGVFALRMRSLGDPTQNQYDDRPLIWGEAWRQATEHPWWGIGPGAYQQAASGAVSRVSARPADHPHDLPLTILAERGMIGVGLAVVVVVGCALAARRLMRHGDELVAADRLRRTRGLAVIAGLIAVAIHGTFDMPLRNPIVAGLVWTLLGIAVVVDLTTKQGRSAEPGPRRTLHPLTLGSEPPPC
ncbi:O-antigen ligase [Nocardioides thalensis]|uniref:O-antigen ligase n=1 Tax=Nocardioides thalensis TaxID=1914755 RepID=A0A853C339_9ACTN|nr:O-antigen ligase [Nocardioides thalensis]